MSPFTRVSFLGNPGQIIAMSGWCIFLPPAHIDFTLHSAQVSHGSQIFTPCLLHAFRMVSSLSTTPLFQHNLLSALFPNDVSSRVDSCYTRGHIRPTVHLAMNLSHLFPNLFISFLADRRAMDRIPHEISSHPELLEGVESRWRLVPLTDPTPS